MPQEQSAEERTHRSTPSVQAASLGPFAVAKKDDGKKKSMETNFRSSAPLTDRQLLEHVKMLATSERELLHA
jgi:hypothetical protein